MPVSTKIIQTWLESINCWMYPIMPVALEYKTRNRCLSFVYSKIQSIAVKSSYPTLRPGPSTYQSSGASSLGSNVGGVSTSLTPDPDANLEGLSVSTRGRGGPLRSGDDDRPDKKRVAWENVDSFCLRLKLRVSGVPLSRGSSLQTASLASFSAKRSSRSSGSGADECRGRDKDDDDEAPVSCRLK